MNKQQITILMAIYKPNLKWLEAQLTSLNEQTYDNLQLLVWNDCPTDKTDYEPIFHEYITRFPYKIFTGEKNLGSNGAFGELTKLATTEYVAYCDQDDIWLPEKLTTLMEVAESRAVPTELICSDMYVINGAGEIQADSITKIRPRHIFTEGDGQFFSLLSRDFVTGCTTLVKADFAKRILPFPQEFVHDWWLALHAAADNSLHIVHRPLIKYRLHGGNQTVVLAGVTDKASYVYKRLKPEIARIKILESQFGKTHPNELASIKAFAAARLAYHEHHSLNSFCELFRQRSFHKGTAYLELMLPFMPETIFSLALILIRRGII